MPGLQLPSKPQTTAIVGTHFHPTESRRLSWPEWLVTIKMAVSHVQSLTLPTVTTGSILLCQPTINEHVCNGGLPSQY